VDGLRRHRDLPAAQILFVVVVAVKVIVVAAVSCPWPHITIHQLFLQYRFGKQW
jgi:hypothetical protein